MTKNQLMQYNYKKDRVIREILDLLEFKFGYETIELVIMSKELKCKCLKYLVYYKNRLIKHA